MTNLFVSIPRTTRLRMGFNSISIQLNRWTIKCQWNRSIDQLNELTLNHWISHETTQFCFLFWKSIGYRFLRTIICHVTNWNWHPSHLPFRLGGKENSSFFIHISSIILLQKKSLIDWPATLFHFYILIKQVLQFLSLKKNSNQITIFEIKRFFKVQMK